jgi:hypothetical protein
MSCPFDNSLNERIFMILSCYSLSSLIRGLEELKVNRETGTIGMTATGAGKGGIVAAGGGAANIGVDMPQNMGTMGGDGRRLP